MTSPPPHYWHWRLVDKWTKCLQEFSALDPGLVLGPLSQMTINYHQQVWSEDPIFTIIGHLSPSSREAARAPRHDPVLITGPRRQLVGWELAGKLQMMMTRPWLCQLSSPRPRWLIDASDIPSGSGTFIRLKLEISVGLPPSLDVKQYQTQHVSQLSHRLRSQKIIISGIIHVNFITPWFMRF